VSYKLQSEVSSQNELIDKVETGDFKRIATIHSANYFVSPHGELISLNKPNPKVLAPREVASGEIVVVLFTPRMQRYLVAQLVLEQFVGPSDERVPVYKDGDPRNVYLDNLSWGTAQQLAVNQTNVLVARSRAHLERNAGSARPTATPSEKNTLTKNMLFYFNRFLLEHATLLQQNELEDADLTKLRPFIDGLSCILANDAFCMTSFKNLCQPDFQCKELNDAINDLFETIVRIKVNEQS